MKTIFKSLKLVIVLGTIMFLNSSCDTDNTSPKVEMFYGPAVNVGNGSARTEVRLNQFSEPIWISIVFSGEFLEELPDEMTSYMLQLPEQADITPFKHVALDWNPHGHAPDSVYDLPHFDIHFYMISNEDRLAIGVNDTNAEKLPPEGFMPANYIPFPGYVPQMGKHWGDPQAPEFNGEVFTQTMLMGSYNEKTIFYEPMMTVDYIRNKPSHTWLLSLPENYEHEGKYYPTKYTVVSSYMKNEFTVMLKEFEKR
ncbi:DUF5602 domain-containing protein [Saccharicrinis sp. FJH62]|uniref:DUF5602 domain-containing protein n=1 Tax=Saccharicrinis sp. FJH62 TaxID=3344657 RepID=UPI0035D412F6